MQKVTGHLKIIGSQESSWLGIPTLDEINQYLKKKLSTLDMDSKSGTDNWDTIELLAKTPAAINNLMRYYYEPTDEDRLLHRKLPSGFHRQLAQSISNSMGQIMITTNRDRLIEWGLAELGITPQVISQHQDLTTLIPVQHIKCTLIKLNGDYLDLQRPKFEPQLLKFLQDKIQNIYEPEFLKCCLRDRARLAQFNFKFN